MFLHLLGYTGNSRVHLLLYTVYILLKKGENYDLLLAGDFVVEKIIYSIADFSWFCYSIVLWGSDGLDLIFEGYSHRSSKSK